MTLRRQVPVARAERASGLVSRADTSERILDATLATVSAHGLARLSLEDVAREAAVSRQTVYRYFGSKEALVTEMILREEETFIASVLEAAAAHTDVRAAIEAAIARALLAAREHPLLDRLLATEPEALLPFLTTGGGPVLSAARPILEGLLGSRLPTAEAAQVRRVADLATRLFISYAINPPDETLPEVASGLAGLILDGLEGPA